MGLLSAADIAGMRAVAEEALPSKATIKRKVKASDGQGGKTEQLKVRAADLPARLDPARKGGEAESGRGGRTSASSDFLITFPAGTVCKPTDVVELGGRSFEVDRPRDRDEWEITVRVEATEIDVGGPADVE